VTDQTALLTLVAVFGAVSGMAFVAIGVALGASSTPATRGLVMGGYSTSLYLGLALGSFTLGPVITRYGYVPGFAIGGATGVLGALVAALLWAAGARERVERGPAIASNVVTRSECP